MWWFDGDPNLDGCSHQQCQVSSQPRGRKWLQVPGWKSWDFQSARMKLRSQNKMKWWSAHKMVALKKILKSCESLLSIKCICEGISFPSCPFCKDRQMHVGPLSSLKPQEELPHINPLSNLRSSTSRVVQGHCRNLLLRRLATLIWLPAWRKTQIC